MGDWKEQRRQELEVARENAEEAKQLLESPQWQAAQAAFFQEMVDIGDSWDHTAHDAMRVCSIISFIIDKMKKPFQAIEKYEQLLKVKKNVDPDSN